MTPTDIGAFIIGMESTGHQVLVTVKVEGIGTYTLRQTHDGDLPEYEMADVSFDKDDKLAHFSMELPDRKPYPKVDLSELDVPIKDMNEREREWHGVDEPHHRDCRCGTCHPEDWVVQGKS